MRLLIVTWYFPPANTIAAVRINKMARYLMDQGMDVRVLCARDIPMPPGLEADIPESHIRRAEWTDVAAHVKKWVARLRFYRRPVAGQSAFTGGQPRQQDDSTRSSLSEIVKDLLFFPDFQWGWIRPATRTGERLAADWQPDAVYATAPPFSCLMIGHRLARRLKIPLFVEFRDRWSDDPYYPPSRLRSWLDRRFENRIVAHASGVVTVSEPWAEAYRARFGKPTQVVYNGFDPELVDPARATLSREGPLKIVYTGRIYPGRRDPSLLFEAIREIGANPEDVTVDFYGTQEDHVWPIAESYGVSDCVRVYPPIDYAQAVRKQLEADVLLLMQWQDPREQGNVPGKLFEYLGARRPILLIGLEGGVPDTFVRDRGAGHLARDGRQVADLLSRWITEKREHGQVPLLPESVSAGLSHGEQFARLPDFLKAHTGEVRRVAGESRNVSPATS